MSSEGASNNERLLAAARSDSEELLLEVLNGGDFDINFKDGVGMTALHYAASLGSTDVLEHILEQDECDVDPINRLEKATPLHLALRDLKDPEVRSYVVKSLVEAGADCTIKDKNGDTAMDLLQPQDEELRRFIRKTQAQNSVSRGDIADDDDDEGSAGSGSESE
ncbi:ankyrin [Pyrrhoderma noxium]|uniref:Ankyrin n=1 Tax=Pyrrhoderma noxium TaxID=2282107 RepID=A0A286USM5_9AGAM|nr:ankyrin [Pyrrhoderma noxium]